MTGLYPVPADFDANIRIFKEDEGGRKSAPFNGVRWDLNYADDLPTAALYMIWPDFVDDVGVSLPTDTALPIDTLLNARMHIVIDEMRSQLHRARLKIGTRFYCCEGPRRVAEGQVTRITGLHFERALTAVSVELSAETCAQVEGLLRENQRIYAIHAIRAATGVGLGQAKALMEEMLEKLVCR
jgi:hypothetical protein